MNRRVRIRTCLLLCAAAWLCAGRPAVGGEPPAASGTTDDDIECRINGEAITKTQLREGLQEATEQDPRVCPTDAAAGWNIRRSRLIEYLPLRQFLDKEGVKVDENDVTALIEEMKKHPDPFGKYPPKPLPAVMVRDCISWSDLRLMIRVDMGMRKWAEAQWQEKWPTTTSWEEHCRNEAASFGERYGKFSRMSFPISSWPDGARDEAGAMALLKKRADEAHARLEKGEGFDALGKDPELKASLIPARVLPLDVLGSDHTETLKALKPGQFSEPLDTPLSWEIMNKEKMLLEDVSEVLKIETIARMRAEAEKRVAAEAVIEKVNWTDENKIR